MPGDAQGIAPKQSMGRITKTGGTDIVQRLTKEAGEIRSIRMETPSKPCWLSYYLPLRTRKLSDNSQPLY